MSAQGSGSVPRNHKRRILEARRPFGVPTQAQASHPAEALERALLAVVEAQIIPRLLLLSQDNSGQKGVEVDVVKSQPTTTQPAAVEQVVRCAIDGSPAGIRSAIADQLESGAGTSGILLELLAPAARRLGVMWERDEISFVDVTMALGRLQGAVIGLYRPLSRRPSASNGRNMLLMLAPGDTHSFGAYIAAEVFRSHDWQVTVAEPSSVIDVSDRVREADYGVIGFSLSSVVLLDQLERAIATARGAARQHDVYILAGGHVFAGQPDLAARVGADSAPQTLDEAVAFAEAHVGREFTSVRH